MTWQEQKIRDAAAAQGGVFPPGSVQFLLEEVDRLRERFVQIQKFVDAGLGISTDLEARRQLKRIMEDP